MSRIIENVLIAGANGQLAKALYKAAPANIHCATRTRQEMDICDPETVTKTIAEVQPSLVINGSSYNFVDKAESSGMADSYRINAFGVNNLALACKQTGVPLVHFSTDIVFDGSKKSPYEVEDCAHPLNVYGISKLAGEHATLAACSRNLVIRVSRLFGEPHAERRQSGSKPIGNFPLLMLYLYRKAEPIKLVNDQIGTPSYLPDVAKAVWELLQTGQTGLFHIANAGEVSFSDYAKTIFRLAGMDDSVVIAMPTKEYGAPAIRPLYSTLSSRRALDCGVTPLRPWHEALAEFLSTFKSGDKLDVFG